VFVFGGFFIRLFFGWVCFAVFFVGLVGTPWFFYGGFLVCYRFGFLDICGCRGKWFSLRFVLLFRCCCVFAGVFNVLTFRGLGLVCLGVCVLNLLLL